MRNKQCLAETLPHGGLKNKGSETGVAEFGSAGSEKEEQKF